MVRMTLTKGYASEARLLISHVLTLRTPSHFLGQSPAESVCMLMSRHFYSFLQRHFAHSTIPNLMLRQLLHIVRTLSCFLITHAS
jgi:hypothetical protein